MGEKVYGLLGRKLGHSWSAPIHAALSCADYRLIELEPEELGAFLAREDIGGLNVTIPYKRDVMAYCDVLDPMAEAIGSVNTLVRRADGKLYGYNTDAAGFCFMAQRAGIELTDKTYCAAVLRLFPGIDIDAIDGQTVEDAKVLQQAISAYVDELCVRPVHNYKRNTLETLYMFEIQDQEKLLGVLHRVAAWLHEQYHVEAHWGVGTPCDDLMQFWKSAEEAAAAQHDADGGTAVQVYGSQLGARDGYYFPYVVEERLTQSLSAGDAKAVEDVLSLLQTENFVRRSLNRSRMRQLNRRIVEILSAQTGVIVEENADLMALNELAFDYKGDCEPYFERLNPLCQALCSEVTQQKNARRSENVKAIEEYIRKNYHNPNLGLAMVSAEFNLSEGYLSAIFKKETGTNFAEYLEQLRVKAACVLLQDGCKVSDLPERLGYNSIQSFRRAFKRVMGVSPSEYRG